MSKIEILNKFITTYSERISGEEIRKTVKEIFNIDLEAISNIGEGTQPILYPDFIKIALANTWYMLKGSEEFINQLKITSKDISMDIFLKSCGKSITPDQIYQVINGIYGVNIQGICSIEHLRISLFSKGQWILKSDKDLLTVVTGAGDVDFKINSTSYYNEYMGSDQLPDELQLDLINLGFSYNAQMKAFYYANPAGESIPSTLKDQIMGVVIKYAQQLVDMMDKQ